MPREVCSEVPFLPYTHVSVAEQLSLWPKFLLFLLTLWKLVRPRRPQLRFLMPVSIPFFPPKSSLFSHGVLAFTAYGVMCCPQVFMACVAFNWVSFRGVCRLHVSFLGVCRLRVSLYGLCAFKLVFMACVAFKISRRVSLSKLFLGVCLLQVFVACLAF